MRTAVVLAAGFYVAIMTAAVMDYATDQIFRCQTLEDHVLSYLIMPLTLSNTCDHMKAEGALVSFMFRMATAVVYGSWALNTLWV
jgi:hypothetical protein